MSNHPIWRINLFRRTEKQKAECLECKKEGKEKYEFALSDNSIKSLITHVQSPRHKESEKAKEFEKLMEQWKKGNTRGQCHPGPMDKFAQQQHSSGLYFWFMNFKRFVISSKFNFLGQKSHKFDRL